MARVTKQLVLASVNVTILTLFYKMTDIVNSVINGNPSLNLNPEKCIMHFQELRTTCMRLDPQIERR
jgi:hypothetical protein